MRYKCLILDHDDTVTMSTPNIHYPSFVEALKVLRPNTKLLTFEEFVHNCFSPGFSELCKDVLKFSKEEQEYQYKVWTSYTKSKIPDFYPGFAKLIKKFKNLGGIICVASHSESKQIERDYKINCGVVPDKIFGWDIEEGKRKPNHFPIEETMRLFNLNNEDILVVDDLKPGLDMAKACKVDFASAGWSHVIPEIIEFMKENSNYYLTSVSELSELVL
ncbi:HAD family hydrolase [Clostridium tertium]|jgi:phosphoglycolate phosphatase/pyrophosphatase PpaX|uniref:HAD family hydrolase n=1 Tax=Clostridium tertium TaxID=1559 RepID=UPI001C1E61BF|nr:HAD hydrolase-like protein [Clostridium tertium]MBU6135636.1 HAD hydrolase-like protein [Clostridium tertium]